MSGHECLYELDPFGEGIRCCICGVAEHPPMERHLHQRQECGDTFESEFVRDSLCDNCLEDNGMHPVTLGQEEAGDYC